MPNAEHLIGVLCLLSMSVMVLFYYTQKEDSINEINCEGMQLKEKCQTLEVAKACKAIPYCIHCEWNTLNNPYETDDGKCISCIQAVVQRRLSSNSTDEEFIAAMENACDIQETEEEKSMCLDLLQNYTTDSLLWDIGKVNLSPMDICSLLGHCYSRFKIVFAESPQASDSMNERKGIIIRKNAGLAKNAKIYRIGGKSNGYFLPSYTPIFIPHSDSIQDSKYYCEFQSHASPIFPARILAIVLTSVWTAYQLNLRDNRRQDDY